MNRNDSNDETEARLTRALSTVAERTGADSDWDRVVADANPARRPGSGFGPAMFAAVAVVLVLAGLGLTFLTAGGEETVSVSSTADFVLPGEVVLSEDPLIVAAAAGPEPTFDTSSLGTEIVLDPVDEIDDGVAAVLDAQSLRTPEDSGILKITVIGRFEDETWISVARDELDQSFPDLDENEILRTWSVANTQGSSGIGDIVPAGSLRFIAPPAVDGDGWAAGVSFTSPEGWVEWGPLPSEVAVVGFADSEDRRWTRTRGGVALIPARIASGERFTVEAFGVDGALLGSITETADSGASEDVMEDSAVPAEGEVIEEAMGDAPAVLLGTWASAETSLSTSELAPLLVPFDDGLFVLHTQNNGNDVDGEVYDPTTDTATTLVPSGQVWRFNPAVAWTGQKLLMVGGSNGPGIEDLALVHNPDAETWRALPDPPEELHQADETILGPGAWTGTELLLWHNGLALDPETERWRAMAELPGPRRAFAASVWTGDRLVVWGGCDAAIPQCDDIGEGLLTDGHLYDPAADTWTPLAPSPLAPGVHPVAVWTGDDVVVYSGLVEPGSEEAYAARYDPATDSWSELPAPPIAPRRYAAAAWTGTHVIVWGGERDGQTFGDGAALNPETGNWFSLPDAPVGSARDRHAMAWLGDRLYIAGGSGANGPLVFIPS